MLLFGDVELPIHAELNEFPLHHFARDVDEDVEDFELSLGERQVEGGHVKPVPHRGLWFVAPLRVDGRSPAPHFGVVDDIVMHQRGGVNQFDDGTEPIGDFTPVAACLCGQKQEGRPDPLAPAVVHVFADAVNQMDIGSRMAGQFLLHQHQVIFDELENLSWVQDAALRVTTMGKNNQRHLTTGAPNISKTAAGLIPSRCDLLFQI